MSYADQTTQKDKIAYIKERLSSNSFWTKRAVIRIFENQTQDEQHCEDTIEGNGIGFTGADANILTSFAKQILNGRNMSSKQQAILFKRMPKYARQLSRMVKVITKAQPGVKLNLTAIDDEELLALFHSLQGSVQYYEASEGNYDKETGERNECIRQFNKAVKEAEHRGLL